MKSSLTFTHLRKAWCVFSLLAVAATAAPPVVKTVPWVASNPLVAHPTFTGKAITLKGTCDTGGAAATWTWDFGDGSPVANGNVTDPYVLQATHTYAGPVNSVFTARLTVQNTGTGETTSKPYYIQMVDKTLDNEANVAIDEGLWFLHKTQERSDIYGYWWGGNSWGYQASLGFPGPTAANVNAFEVNGHVESGSADDPYTETVHRGLNQLFAWLDTIQIGIQTPPDPPAVGRDPDVNGNGIGLVVSGNYQYYQGGMFIDAIVASGTPNAVAAVGSSDVMGRSYKDIVQDMVDAYAWAQYDGYDWTNTYRLGGWRYSANEWPDNSACQWAAIGLLAAERIWGCTIPQWVKDWNTEWLIYSQNPSNGQFGYTDTFDVWGPFAVTPSGMVQMVLDGLGRGLSPAGGPNWELAETFMRDNFGNTGSAYDAVRSYYYGMFSFVKAMLLHNGNGGAISMLHSQTAGVADVDWYRAEVANGDPMDGVARTLVSGQDAGGFWFGHNVTYDQYFFETAWAIMMLHQTVFESGAPVAVAKAVPNPAISGQTITLDGSDSYHQDLAKHIVKWEWDVNASGTFIDAGPVVLTSFASVGNYPVKLRVTDDALPAKTAVTTLTVVVSTPPLPPTADANGPYHFCASLDKWFVDGRASRNPDEGMHEIGTFPGDTIQEYAWDLDGNNDFLDASGPTPDVKQFFLDHHMGVGSYIIRLRVTDTTHLSYPDSGLADQVSITSAIVYVDDTCACVTLEADAVIKGVMLSWNAFTGASSYNIYRSDTSGGPYTWIANVTELDHEDHAPGPLNQKYYYIVRPAALNGDELCQSNEASAEPQHPAPVAFCVPNAVANVPFYYKVDGTSKSFGHMQLGLYVGDTASAQVVGPLPAGSTIYLRTHYSVASARAGVGTIERYITVKGSARVWAQDPLLQKSAEVIVP